MRLEPGAVAFNQAISQSLADIRRSRTEVLKLRELALTLQSRVSRMDSTVGDQLERLNKSVDVFRATLFTRDSEPL